MDPPPRTHRWPLQIPGCSFLDLQAHRTPEEIKKAKYIAGFGSWPDLINPTDSDYAENLRELFYVAGLAVGSWYNPDNFPATIRLLLHCIQDIRITEFRLKRYFKRARPYHSLRQIWKRPKPNGLLNGRPFSVNRHESVKKGALRAPFSTTAISPLHSPPYRPVGRKYPGMSAGTPDRYRSYRNVSVGCP